MENVNVKLRPCLSVFGLFTIKLCVGRIPAVYIKFSLFRSKILFLHNFSFCYLC